MDGETADMLMLDDNGWQGVPILLLPEDANRELFEQARRVVEAAFAAVRDGTVRVAGDLRQFKLPRGCEWQLVNRGESRRISGMWIREGVF